jgi:hypothetical protein
LNYFWTLVKPLSTINRMQKHECTKMLLGPMMNFNLNEKYYFSIFHEHKHTKLNHFHLFQKGVNFRVLQIYPP